MLVRNLFSLTRRSHVDMNRPMFFQWLICWWASSGHPTGRQRYYFPCCGTYAVTSLSATLMWVLSADNEWITRLRKTTCGAGVMEIKSCESPSGRLIDWTLKMIFPAFKQSLLMLRTSKVAGILSSSFCCVRHFVSIFVWPLGVDDS